MFFEADRPNNGALASFEAEPENQSDFGQKSLILVPVLVGFTAF